MCKPFLNTHKEIADSMGIALYQRFTLNEASLFLRCPAEKVKLWQDEGKLNYIKISDAESQFFGYQLLEYLLANVTNNSVPAPALDNIPDRIIRAKEVVKMTGLSRTTIWRLEKKGTFPKRVSLGAGSVGWRFSEVQSWMQQREEVP